MIYHGVRRTPSSSIYRLGLALFDIEQPEKCIARGDLDVCAEATTTARDVGRSVSVSHYCG
jgi:hypothetical protein